MTPAWWAKHLTDELRSDWRLLYGQTFNISNLINKDTIFSPGSEGYFRRAALIARLKNPLQAFGAEKISEPVYLGKPSANIFFVNGVITHHDIAILQRDALIEATGQDVGLLYNPTKSLIADLLECHHERYGENVSPSSLYVASHVLERVKSERDVVLVGYSQGAIISTAAIRELSKELTLEEMGRITFVSFGAGFRRSVLPDDIKQEHFANTLDPVVSLGLLMEEREVTGHVYSRDAAGHLFIADYLRPFMLGEFGKKSLFCDIVNRSKNCE
jgi:hypothetical protein